MLEHLISAAYAQGTQAECPPGTTCLANPVGTTSVSAFIGQVINVGLGVLGSLALLAFFYGGFLWLTSAGDPKKVDGGKEVMKWAAIGLIIVFGAAGAVRLVFKVVLGQ